MDSVGNPVKAGVLRPNGQSGINMLPQRLRAAAVLLMLLFAGQAPAADDRNLAVKQVSSAASEQRIALVIGNSAYINSPLKNPVNDAKDMANKLRGLGFYVIERNNLQTKQIGGTLREFRSKLVPGAVALVFYAGHGLQIKGVNYLPAVDADINSEEDVPNQSIAVSQIMDVLDEAKTRLNLVFLDACRNNPYASRGFRSADKGLARVSAPSGTLISYATRPGSVAADGDGRNGLYTSKLLMQMDSNLQIEQTLKRVVTEVKSESQGKQEPWMEGSIEGDFCFAGCEASGDGGRAVSMAPVPPRVKTKEEIEQETWESARDSANIGAIQEYLKQYPKGLFVGQARVLIATLKDMPAKSVESSGQPTREEIEQEVWDSARDSANVAALQEYLKQYPKGRFSGQARVLIATLKAAPAKPAGQTAPLGREDDETALWTEAQKGGSKEDYDAYLAQYPKGKYAALARSRINKLQDEVAAIAAKQELESWQQAQAGEDAQSVQAYIDSYPSGRFALAAQEKLIAIAARQELELWQQAQAGENAQSMQAYLDRYPNGRYAAVARDALAVRQERELWQQVEPSDSAQAVQSYLDKYPKGRYVAAALEILAAIAAQQEQDVWQKSKEVQGDERGHAVQSYLDKYPDGRYVAAARKELGKMANVGYFGADKPDEREVRCWGFKVIKTPDGTPFPEFVRKSLMDEMKTVNAYYPKAAVTLTGKLDVIRFSYGSGEWELALTVRSSNGKGLSVSETYSYKTSSSAEVACDQTAEAFRPAVQNLIGKILKSPEFPALVAKDQSNKPGDEAAQQGRLEQEAAAREAERQEKTAWESAKSTATEAAYQDYLAAYPRGHYMHLAAARIANLKKEAHQAAPQATPQATSQAAPQAAAASQAAPKAASQVTPAGITFRDCAECPEMVAIPAGSFDMGPNDDIHRVTISLAFAMGKTEVTQGQWRAMMGSNPSSFTQCGDTCPVEQVGWNDVQEFIRRLNQKTGKHYRLPTEAEWEYACRAGGRQEYCGGDDVGSVAWYEGNSGNTTNPAGRKQANAFGLYDMSGNVWEWVEDSWHDDFNGAPTDGSDWQGDGAKRVLRGGSWYLKQQVVRAASRNRHEPSYLGSGSGFRLARTLP